MIELHQSWGEGGFGLVDIADGAKQRIDQLEKEINECNKEAQRSRLIAEGLSGILTILNSNQPLGEILNYIVSQASRLAGTDAVGIYQLDEEDGVLRIQASSGINADYAAEREVPTDRGIVGRAVMNRQPLIVPDMAKAFSETLAVTRDQRQKTITERFISRFRAMLAVPLVVEGNPYGAIALYYPEVREFSDDEVALAIAFSNQAALAIENARLRAGIERAAIAAERNRLARDLHDAVTQTLFSASLIAEVLPKLWDRDREEGRRRLEELRLLTRGALAEMRALLLELRPKALAEADIGDLLGHLAESASAAQVLTEFRADGECLLPVEVKIALYRIAQEAMNNVVRHSGAKEARINLICGSGEVELEITDDGKGFDPKRTSGQSLGIGIMHERAEAVGAQLRIDGRIDQGTIVRVIWGRHEEKV